jgi:hypothetical protein
MIDTDMYVHETETIGTVGDQRYKLVLQKYELVLGTTSESEST